MKIKRIFCLACLLLLGGYASAGAAGMQPGGYRMMGMQGTCLTENVACNQQAEWQHAQQSTMAPLCGQLTEAAPLTAAEQQSLTFLGEEERLARDLYQAFYQQWGTPVFAGIAMAEQRHMDMILCLMQADGMADTAAGTAGVFTDPELQARYASLLARGAGSQAEALTNAALVEELDIQALQAALAGTANENLSAVYDRLLGASEQHLRAFVTNLESLGFAYAAQELDPAQLTEILNGGNRHGGVAFSRGGRMQPTNAGFTGIFATATGQYGNHQNVTQQDRLSIGMLMTPDRQHLGQFADVVNMASYTPPGSEQSWMFMRSGATGWQPWDGNPDSLVPAEARQQLMGQNRLAIHEGQLQAPGSFRIQAGYRLQDGTLVLCGAPIEFTVE